MAKAPRGYCRVPGVTSRLPGCEGSSGGRRLQLKVGRAAPKASRGTHRLAAGDGGGLGRMKAARSLDEARRITSKAKVEIRPSTIDTTKAVAV